MLEKYAKIIAYMYQIAAAHDVPSRILDILADPDHATDNQIEKMLPYYGPNHKADVAAHTAKLASQDCYPVQGATARLDDGANVDKEILK